MARKRLKRKDIKKPDEFVTLSRQVLEWFVEHARVVAWSGGALVLALATIATVAAVRSSRLGAANAELGQAMAALRAENLSSAAQELREVSEKWDGSRVSPLAEILAANTAVRLGNVDAAAAEFEVLHAQAANLPAYLQQEIVYGWGTALEAKGDLAAAAARYAEASELGGPFTAVAILGEARMRDQSGETDRATELYRKAYEQFPELPGREILADRLATS